MPDEHVTLFGIQTLSTVLGPVGDQVGDQVGVQVGDQVPMGSCPSGSKDASGNHKLCVCVCVCVCVCFIARQ